MINNFTLVGNLVADPESSTIKTKNGSIELCKFSIAVNHDKETVSYFNMEAWGNTAELISNYLVKGDRVAVSGEVKQDRWQDENGETRSAVKFIVRTLEFMQGKKTEEPVKKSNSKYRK